MKTAVVRNNDLKLYMRPDTRTWKTNPEVLSQMLNEFKIDSPPTTDGFGSNSKNQVIFADIWARELPVSKEVVKIKRVGMSRSSCSVLLPRQVVQVSQEFNLTVYGDLNG